MIPLKFLQFFSCKIRLVPSANCRWRNIEFSTSVHFDVSLVILSIFALVNHLFARITLFFFRRTASFLRHNTTSEIMSSAEEESFIILDESPSLLEPYSLLQIPKSIEHNSLSCASIRTVDLMDDTDNSRISVGKPIDEQPSLAEMSASQFSMAASQTKESISPNLAESFLLGAIDRNTMMVCAQKTKKQIVAHLIYMNFNRFFSFIFWNRRIVLHYIFPAWSVRPQKQKTLNVCKA